MLVYTVGIICMWHVVANWRPPSYIISLLFILFRAMALLVSRQVHVRVRPAAALLLLVACSRVAWRVTFINATHRATFDLALHWVPRALHMFVHGRRFMSEQQTLDHFVVCHQVFVAPELVYTCYNVLESHMCPSECGAWHSRMGLGPQTPRSTSALGSMPALRHVYLD